MKLKQKKKIETLFHYKNLDRKVTAVIGKDNILGCQFHPEKSGKFGIDFLKKFLENT